MATYHPPHIAEEVGCTSSNTPWAFPTSLEETSCRPHWRDLTSMFTTIGNADTFWRPQFFSTVTLCRFPWHFIAWCGGWDSDEIAENQHKFFSLFRCSKGQS